MIHSHEYYTQKRVAYSIYGKALRDGSLVRQGCERCPEPFGEGHHPDYAKPLDVIWLCSRCHAKEHDALRAAARDRKLAAFHAGRS